MSQGWVSAGGPVPCRRRSRKSPPWPACRSRPSRGSGTWPTLTTIRQPLEQMGAAAAEVLIGGSDAPVRIWEFDLVIRESTAAI